MIGITVKVSLIFLDQPSFRRTSRQIPKKKLTRGWLAARRKGGYYQDNRYLVHFKQEMQFRRA